MIIIEGCDNTGKTTLKDDLLKSFPILRQGIKQKLPPNDRERYMEFLWDLLSQDLDETYYMVFDRVLISEMIYGPILRGKTLFSEAENKCLLKLLALQRPLIIHCQRPVDEILNTFDERDQLDGVKDSLVEIHSRYDEVIRLLHSYGMWVEKYNFMNKKDVKYLKSKITSYLNHK